MPNYSPPSFDHEATLEELAVVNERNQWLRKELSC